MRRVGLLLALVLGLAAAAPADPADAASAYINASPDFVLAPAGGLGTTTIGWSTGDGSTGRVLVSCNGGDEKLFAEGSSGSQQATWIGSGSSCTFVLVNGSSFTNVLGRVVVTGVQAGTITASPSTVSLSPGQLGSVTVSWWTADGSDAEVWVTVNGGDPKLMAHSASGTASPNWIGPGATVFGLYAGTGHSQLLDSVTVTASAPVVSAPAPTTVTPPPTSGRRVNARLVFTWTWNRTHTTLHHASIQSVPHSATVSISCRGRGCFRRVRRAGYRHLRKLLGSLAGTRFSAGDRLLVTISAPGRSPERAEIAIRRAALPLARLL